MDEPSCLGRDEYYLAAHLSILVGPPSRVGGTRLQLLPGGDLVILCMVIALSNVTSESSFPVFSKRGDDESCDQPCSPCATFTALI